MRQIILPALLSLLAVTPVHAQDASNVDIMDIYQQERHAHREKIADAAQKYHDRWFEHVNERYGVTLKGMTPEPAGRAMFDKYKLLENSFDASLADMYDDNAIIGVFWTEDNKPKQMLLKGIGYKEMIRKGVAQAAEKKDRIEYADIAYEVINDGILISGKKTSKVRAESANFKMYMRPQPDGTWLIEEEKLETIPSTPAETADATASGTADAPDASMTPTP